MFGIVDLQEEQECQVMMGDVAIEQYCDPLLSTITTFKQLNTTIEEHVIAKLEQTYKVRNVCFPKFQSIYEIKLFSIKDVSF